jgi:serine/threonine protein kinase
MHAIGIVHGDIKPCNVLIGKSKTYQLTASMVQAYKAQGGPPQNRMNHSDMNLVASLNLSSFGSSSKGMQSQTKPGNNSRLLLKS